MRIIDSGTVFLFLLVTAEARAWVEAHASPDGQMLGIGLAVEPRYAATLADGMAGDGLTVAGEDLYPADEAPLAGFPTLATDELVQTVISTPRQSPSSDRYDLGWLFTCWVWESGCRDWNHALRALARMLRGLERIGVIDRRTIRRAGAPTHHGFVLTDGGHQAVIAFVRCLDRGGRVRAGIYVRVSTLDQHAANQLPELHKYVANRGWEAQEFVDRGVSGAKDSRPALNRLLADARRRRFDVIVVWSLDRLGRSLKHLVGLLDDLQAMGVGIISLREGLDWTTPSGRLQAQLLAMIADYAKPVIMPSHRSTS